VAKTITFIVRGTPIPKGRGRASLAGKAGDNQAQGIYVHTPQKTKNYEHNVKSAAKAAYKGELITGAISVSCEFRMPIPESWAAGKKAAAAGGMIYHTSKPDRDNLEKAVFDACNGTIWKDDSQVVAGEPTKIYHYEPCAIVTIECLEDF
jgi:Holliday junction resolvase RusA-like endonuclease